jgi:hypothetical protein
MKYYSAIHIENLKSIQEKVFEHFPKEELLKRESLFYITDNLNIFLSIPELKAELDKLNWTPYVFSIGFYIIAPTTGTHIHLDSNSFNHSFNIPILNCENTFVNFFKTDKEPKKEVYKLYDTFVNYYRFDPVDCEVVDQLEMVTPHVINVQEPHNVVNKNSKPRITLLIRLRNDIDLSHLFQ